MTIEQLPIPASLAVEGGHAFRHSAGVSDAVERAVWGHDDFRLTADERLVVMQPSPDREYVLGVARDGGTIVATARVAFPLRDNLRAGYLQIDVLPEYRRQGLGDALLAFAEQQVRLRGRTTIMSWSDTAVRQNREKGKGRHAGDDGPVLVPPTGSGFFPAEEPSAMFAVHAGFELVQVDRMSVLYLDRLDGVSRIEQDAGRVGAPDYELVAWGERCPDGLLADYSLLRQRMSTDPPLGGFAQEEERWDADRVRREEERSAASGTSTLVCAARHRATGRLVGHTVLERFGSRPAVVYQEDTLVLEQHRGHRLGMWLKATNLRRVLAEWPDAERIYTWNAEENAFMLEVNAALGFQPAGRTAGWQKVLPLHRFGGAPAVT